MHAGHRQRVKKRFLEKGIDDMEPHVILEMFLYHTIPQKDTNELAHRLLNTFGSPSAVFEAPMEDLMKIEGVGEKTAFFLKTIPQMSRFYLEDKVGSKQRIYETSIAVQVFSPKFIGRTEEALVFMLLDSKQQISHCSVVGEGSTSSVPVHIKKLVTLAAKYNATSAILAHNHPSGSTLPSNEDLLATREVFHALSTVDVFLSDHLIITDSDYLSLARSGLLKDLYGIPVLE